MRSTLLLLLGVMTGCPHHRGLEQATPTMAMDRSADSAADLHVCSADGWCWENPMPQGNDLLAVWARNSRVLAVGRAGTVLSFNGYAWRREVVRDAGDLWAVSAALVGRRELAVVVGDKGAIHTRWATGPEMPKTKTTKEQAMKGQPWLPLTTPTQKTLHAVHVSPSGHIVTVGHGGVALSCTATSPKNLPASHADSTP
ncbi:MAG: hypothetical protein JRH20_04070 [Deltaproteobacteria bacterium]|nr:hypothetical protein [Deltaproteobacteria bacterium]